MAALDDPGVGELVELARKNLDGETPVREEVLFARFEARAARLRQKPERSRWVWASGFAAAAATLAAVLFFATRDPSLTYEVVGGRASGSGYVIGGTETRIRFSDGSAVSLERGAEARVTQLGAHGGRVSVEKGTVRVSIAKLPEAAWTVEAGPYRVLVTGTAFDVRWSRQEQVFELAMHSGSVVVSGPLVGTGLALRAGQRMVGKDGRLMVEGQEESPATTARLEPAPATEPALLPGAAPLASGSVKAAGSDWSKLVAQGNFKAVLAEAEQRGLDRTIATASLGELSALADAARYARRSDLAQRALLAKRQRFSGSASAREAAFFLGRLAEDNGGSAIDWYDRYLRESPRGAYASQALGRKMMLVYQQRGEAAARPLASDYVSRYPSGPYASAARKIVEATPSAGP
jgi:hypothetical protein